MKTSKKWRKPLFRQPERRQGILPALFGARIGALLPSSSQWPLCATAKTASFHSPAQAKRRKITWMPLGPTPDAAPAIGGAEAVNGTKGGRKAPAARGGGGGRAKRAQSGGGALSGPAPTLVWLARGPKAPGPPNAAAPPGRWSFCRRQKAGKSPAPRSMEPGARNAVRKGRGNGFAPRAKPGPMAYGPGRWKPPAAGYLPQGVRSRCCAPTNLRAAPPPAQGQPARSTAMRAAPKGLARCGR